MGLGIASCLRFDPFTCESSTACDDAEGGVCADGFCAYPDLDCAEGLRFDEFAGDGLGGECVGAGTTTSATDAGTVTMSSLDATSPTSLDTTSLPTTTADSGSESTEDSGPACGSMGEACCAGGVCDPGLACANDVCGSCIAAIEAGDRHTCAVRSDGQLFCWGANELGQLGNSRAPFEPLPVLAIATEPDNPIVEVSAIRHTCVRSEAGNVRCWGDNASGQVNPGSPSAIAVPTPAPWAGTSTHVATGVSHTCSTDDVTTECWGSNAENQLSGAAAGPGPIEFGSPGYLALELGGSHSCALRIDDSLACWGNNANGQLAQDPATVPTVVDPTVIPIEGLQGIALGRAHTCVIVDGAVQCWGRNDLGQLGDGSGAQQIAPVSAALPDEAGAIVSITAGTHHTCAVDDGQRLWCWGSNDNGQLMLEPDGMGNDLFTLVPVQLEVGEGVLEVTTGQTHTCARTEDGRVLCWGTNSTGQIGDGTTNFAFEPTEVMFDCG